MWSPESKLDARGISLLLTSDSGQSSKSADKANDFLYADKCHPTTQLEIMGFSTRTPIFSRKIWGNIIFLLTYFDPQIYVKHQ